jgi:hypothetical protein
MYLLLPLFGPRQRILTVQVRMTAQVAIESIGQWQRLV